MSRLKRNLLASFYFTGANQAGQLLQVAAFFRFWGADQYGAWLVLNTIPTCLSYSEGGISTTLGNRLTIDYQQRDFVGASRALNSAWYCQFLIWLCLAFIFAAAICVLPIRAWLGLDGLPAGTFIVTSICMCAWTLIGQQAAILGAVYRASGTYDRYIALWGHFRAIETLAATSMLFLGTDFIGLSATLLLVRVLYMAFCWRRSRGLLPEVRLDRHEASWVTFKTMLPSGFSFLSSSLGNGLINQGTAVLVNHMLGASFVAVVNTCRQLARVYLTITSTAFTAIQPEINHAFAVKDRERAFSLQCRAIGMVLYSAPIFCLLVALTGPTIIRIWTNTVVHANLLMVFFFCLEAAFIALANIAAMSAWSLNQNIRVAIVYITAHLTALAVLCFALRIWGVSAVPAFFSLAGAVYLWASLHSTAAIANVSIADVLRKSASVQVWQTLTHSFYSLLRR